MFLNISKYLTVTDIQSPTVLTGIELGGRAQQALKETLQGT